MRWDDLVRMYFGMLAVERGARSNSELDQCWKEAKQLALYAVNQVPQL